MKNLLRRNISGFTLVELLVIVLIIGILAVVALPKYTTAVELSRVTEAIQKISVMEKQIDLYLLENGQSPEYLCYKDFATVELSGGAWKESCGYYTKNFYYYHPGFYNYNEYIEAQQIDLKYSLLSTKEDRGYNTVQEGELYHCCFTQGTELGELVCRQLKTQGWGYNNSEL